MFTFRPGYFMFTIVLLAIEIYIGVFINDRFVRPYVGDFLVVILLYCFVRTFFTAPASVVAPAVLIFAILVELTQYFHLIFHLGFEHSPLVRALIGGSFDWADIVAYILGFLTLVTAEKFIRPRLS